MIYLSDTALAHYRVQLTRRTRHPMHGTSRTRVLENMASLRIRSSTVGGGEKWPRLGIFSNEHMLGSLGSEGVCSFRQCSSPGSIVASTFSCPCRDVLPSSVLEADGRRHPETSRRRCG